MNQQRTDVRNFILFNTNWGLKEGTEAEKIIYSSRSSERSAGESDSGSQDSDTPASDLKQVSICEASIAFVNLFKVKESDVPVCVEGYAGTILVFRKVESPAFWFLAVISSGGSECDDPSKYHTVYQLLGSMYSSFVKLNGLLKNNAIGAECSALVRSRLTKKCQLFFEWFLTESQLPAPAILLPPATPATVFGGGQEGLVKYLSLDAQSFMSVRSFVHHIIFSGSLDPEIGVMFLYNDNLVTSTLPLRSTRFLYSYFTSHLIPEAVSDEMSWSKKRASLTTYWLYDCKPVFLYLPDETDGCEESDPLTADWSKRDVYAYRSLNGSTLVVVFQSLDLLPSPAGEEEKRKSLLNSIDLYSKQHLYSLTSTVSKASVVAIKASSLSSSTTPDRQLFFHNPSASASLPGATGPDAESGLSFLYYNEANGALKTFLPLPGFNRQSSGSTLNHLNISQTSLSPAEPLGLWTVLEADFRTVLLPSICKESDFLVDDSPSRKTKKKDAEGGTEILAKTDLEDNWICFRRIDQRTLFATLSAHKNLNLEEVAVICNRKYHPNNRSLAPFSPFASLFQ